MTPWHPTSDGLDLPFGAEAATEYRVSGVFLDGAEDDEAIGAVFGVMALFPEHTFVVTVESEARKAAWLEWIAEQGRILPGLIGEKIPDTTSGEGSACVIFASRAMHWFDTATTEPMPRRYFEACEGSPWPLRNVTFETEGAA